MKRRKRRLRLNKSFIIALILFVVFSSVDAFLLNNIFNKNNEDKLTYTRTGNPTYKVCYKENDAYNECLNEGMQYISSLIDYIDIKYNYDFVTNKNTDYTYSYYIEAEVTVFDKDNKSIIYTKKHELLSKKQGAVTESSNYNINESVKIDYNEFNSYIRDLKNSYGITANSNMIVRMYINTNGISKEFKDAINTNDVLEITIPLTERQINITLPSEKLNVVEMLVQENDTSSIKVILVVTLFITLLSMLYVIYIVIKKGNKKNYLSEIKRINKVYDSIVAEGDTSQSKLEEKDFENVIPIKSFEELVDIAMREQKNIIWTEIEHKSGIVVSWYSIIVDKMLYRVIISSDDEKFY